MLRTLRQPRYAALTVLMVVIAGVCVLLGTWQVARLGQKVDANDELRNNAHRAPVAVADVLPIVGQKTPGAHSIQFRQVTATGTFDAQAQQLVRLQTVNGDTGYYVLTPLRTQGAVLLVVRGFLSGTAPAVAPPAPAGTVTVNARIEPGQTRNDDAGRIAGNQIESINPAEQAARLGTPVYNGYAELVDGQPGIGNLVVIPAPDLSNPAGGAVEPQHVAYIIQWYLFAALALAAPIAMMRSETRHRDERDFDHQAETDEPAPSPATPQDQRAATLADRYGKAVRR